MVEKKILSFLDNKEEEKILSFKGSCSIFLYFSNILCEGYFSPRGLPVLSVLSTKKLISVCNCTHYVHCAIKNKFESCIGSHA